MKSKNEHQRALHTSRGQSFTNIQIGILYNKTPRSTRAILNPIFDNGINATSQQNCQESADLQNHGPGKRGIQRS